MASADVEQVKERTDIVALVGEHVRLKRAGSSFKGLCPFHQEDTPSFVVSPTRQMFHCFGCSESGDCFSWLMKREGMTFPEALRVLAQRAGVPLTFERAERREERERLRATLDTAADFYHSILLRTAEGREAREYLRGRGLTDESIATWRLGYVPLVTTPLIEKATDRGVTAQDLLRAGILGEGPRGSYERFYGRVLFPLADAHGSVVGFAGRILHEDPNRPVGKYINSPETVLYTKSRLLYGLDRARAAIHREGYAVIVEGYTDVIASHQVGVEHVVATSGTALTDDHLILLRRVTDTLAFAFVADAAGDAAGRRAIDLAVRAGFTVSLLLLPSGDDPADLALRDSAGWRDAIARRGDAFRFLLERAVARHGAASAAAKRAVSQELLPFIGLMPDAVVRGHYIQELATALAVDSRYLHEDLVRTGHLGRPTAATTAAPVSVLGDVEVLVRREERLLTLLLAAPAVFPLAAEQLPPEAFAGSHTRHLYEAFRGWYDRQRSTGAPLSFAGMRDGLPEDLRRYVDIFSLALDVERDEGLLMSPDRDARVILRELLAFHLRRQLVILTHSLGQTPPEGRQVILRQVASLHDALAQADRLAVDH